MFGVADRGNNNAEQNLYGTAEDSFVHHHYCWSPSVVTGERKEEAEEEEEEEARLTTMDHSPDTGRTPPLVWVFPLAKPPCVSHSQCLLAKPEVVLQRRK